MCAYFHQVSFLEKKVAELENEILMSSEVKSKLKQDNTQLVHRYSLKAGVQQYIRLFQSKRLRLNFLIFLG